MKREETLVSADFIGCGLFSLAEWAQLSLDERREVVAARDGLMQRFADMIVDTLMETMDEAGEDARLSARMDELEQKRRTG